MGAAEIAATLVREATPNAGMKIRNYTITIVTQNDWAIFSDFSIVTNVYAEVAATGVLNACTIDSTVKNKVVFTSATTGAMRVVVFGY
jgi:hypothetical protein